MDQYLKNLYNFRRQLNPKNLSTKRLEKLKRGERPDAIVVVGMGGSGIVGNVLDGVRNEIKISAPVKVVKTPKIPKIPFKNPLCVFVSFSGNTSETINALREAKRRGVKKMAVVTGGGRLHALAERYKLPEVAFDNKNLTPREALGYTYSALKKLLLAQPAVFKIRRFKIPEFHYRSLDRLGKSLAGKIKNKTTLLYACERDAHLGYLWKAALNETGKVPAFQNSFPEVAHNEIVGFESRLSKSNYILFLAPPYAKADPLLKSLSVFLRIAKNQGINSSIVSVSGRNAEEVAWNAHLLAHFTAYYLAKINRKNPIETKLIDQFKKLTQK